jgi:hypothetical protein
VFPIRMLANHRTMSDRASIDLFIPTVWPSRTLDTSQHLMEFDASGNRSKLLVRARAFKAVGPMSPTTAPNDGRQELRSADIAWDR